MTLFSITNFFLFFLSIHMPTIILSYTQINNHHPRLNQQITETNHQHHHRIDSVDFDWEFGLKESTLQALITEEYHYRYDELRNRIYSAPILGKQTKSTPFGDVALLARGQLYINHNHVAFIFVQDSKYEEDCLKCNRCLKSTGCRQLGDGVVLMALWTIRRIRHRHLEHNQKYEIEYTISPVRPDYLEEYLTEYGKINYNIPGHIFVLKNKNLNQQNSYGLRHGVPIAQTVDGRKFILPNVPTFITGITRDQSIYSTSASTALSSTASSTSTQQTDEGQQIYQILLEILKAKTSQKPNSTAATSIKTEATLNHNNANTTIRTSTPSTTTLHTSTTGTTKKIVTTNLPNSPFLPTTATQPASHLFDFTTNSLTHSTGTVSTRTPSMTKRKPSTIKIPSKPSTLTREFSKTTVPSAKKPTFGLNKSTTSSTSHTLSINTSPLSYRTTKPTKPTKLSTTYSKLSGITTTMEITRIKPTLAMTIPSSISTNIMGNNQHQMTSHQSIRNSQATHMIFTKPSATSNRLTTPMPITITSPSIFSMYPPRTNPSKFTVSMITRNKPVHKTSTSKVEIQKQTLPPSATAPTKYLPSTLQYTKITPMTQSTSRYTPASITKVTKPLIVPTHSSILSTKKTTSGIFTTRRDKNTQTNANIYATAAKPLSEPFVTPTKSSILTSKSTTTISSTIQNEMLPNTIPFTTVPDKSSSESINSFSTTINQNIFQTKLPNGSTATAFIPTYIPPTTILKEEISSNRPIIQFNESTLLPSTITTVTAVKPISTFMVTNPTEATSETDQSTINQNKFTLFSPETMQTTLEFKTSNAADYSTDQGDTTNSKIITITSGISDTTRLQIDVTTKSIFYDETNGPSLISSTERIQSLKPSSQISENDFLVDDHPEQNPSVPFGQQPSRDYDDDDIFGKKSKSSTRAPLVPTTKEYVISDVEYALFNSSRHAKRQKNGGSRKRRINFRKFSQQSTFTSTTPTTKILNTKRPTKAIKATTESSSPLVSPKNTTQQEKESTKPLVTRKSYLTSISFEVNKRKLSHDSINKTEKYKNNKIKYLDKDFADKLFSQVKSIEYLENVGRSTTENIIMKKTPAVKTKKYARRRTYIPIAKQIMKMDRRNRIKKIN